MDKKTIGIVIVVAIIVVIGVSITGTSKTKKVEYEYEPVSIDEIDQIKTCVKEVTGSETINVEELLKDQILLSDVYRYCLKTVGDQEAILEELAK